MKRKWFATVIAVITAYLGAFGLLGGVIFSAVTETSGAAELKIVIDAGHGGMDGGVVGKTTGVKESDLNLSIAYKLKDKLSDAGFEVVMTRKTEAGLYDAPTKGFKSRDMQKRKEIVETVLPALVVSVHQNYYPSSAPRGGQVFYQKGHQEGSVLAENIQEGLNALYGDYAVKNRKAMGADFYMLRFPMPAVIVECGFLSSSKDEALLIDPLFKEKLASAITAGIVHYFEKVADGV